MAEQIKILQQQADSRLIESVKKILGNQGLSYDLFEKVICDHIVGEAYGRFGLLAENENKVQEIATELYDFLGTDIKKSAEVLKEIMEKAGFTLDFSDQMDKVGLVLAFKGIIRGKCDFSKLISERKKTIPEVTMKDKAVPVVSREDDDSGPRRDSFGIGAGLPGGDLDQ